MVAWLIWGYERLKKPEDRSGIIAPELYAIEQIDDKPPNVYLHLAEMSPADLLAEIKNPYSHSLNNSGAGEILRKLRGTPLVALLEEIADEDAG